MTNREQSPEWSRLDDALAGVAITFRGMTARPDETNCECHWGSADELALLKVPDVELDPDLLRRTWDAPDWDDHASVLRRILPQLTTALVNGQVEPLFDLGSVGQSFTRGHWQCWPAGQAAAVAEFMHAWWAQVLTDPAPVVPAHDVLALCVEACGTVSPWLDIWQAQIGPVADRHLALAVTHWADDLDAVRLPWDVLEDEDDKLAGLTAWLVHHGLDRLHEYGVAEELLDRIRLLSCRAGCADPDRADSDD